MITEPETLRTGNGSKAQNKNGRSVLPEMPRSQTAKLIVIISAGLSFFFRLEHI